MTECICFLTQLMMSRLVVRKRWLHCDKDRLQVSRFYHDHLGEPVVADADTALFHRSADRLAVPFLSRFVAGIALCASPWASIAAEPACPKTFLTLSSLSEAAFENYESRILHEGAKSRCKAARALVDIEQKLLNFLEEHQVGCEIDVSKIEQQHQRLKRAREWELNDAVGCGIR